MEALIWSMRKRQTTLREMHRQKVRHFLRRIPLIMTSLCETIAPSHRPKPYPSAILSSKSSRLNHSGSDCHQFMALTPHALVRDRPDTRNGQASGGEMTWRYAGLGTV